MHSLPFVYADDTALLVRGSNKSEIEKKLELDLQHLSGWFMQNKLCLHSSKTKCMLISGKRSVHRNETLSVHLDEELIENVSVMKYLGVKIDNHLSFEANINVVCGKLAARTGLLWRIRNFIPLQLAMTLYTSLIYPHLLYANFVLDGTTLGLKNQLQVQQNNALRAVLKWDYMHSSAQLYAEAETDQVTTTMKKSLCNIVYQGINNIGAPVYNDMFNYALPSRELRSGDLMLAEVPKCRTKFGENNMAYCGAIYWIQLPLHIKQSESLDAFKRQMKTYSSFDT